MQGHLRLVCAPDARGVSVLREQSFRAPVHISKPHRDGATLVVNVVNPTPGFFAGDFLRYDVRVESGGSLLLTAPSASRAHHMRGGLAQVEQYFEVAAGGFLEVLPEVFIPQKGARFKQTTVARLDPLATYFQYETIAPGRVASGEVFAYDWLEWKSEVHVGTTCAVWERLVLKPGEPQVRALVRAYPEAYFGSVFAAGPFLEESPVGATDLEELRERLPWVGCSVTCVASAYCFRVVAPDAIELRAVLGGIRALLHRKAGLPMAGFRRVAGR